LVLTWVKPGIASAVKPKPLGEPFGQGGSRHMCLEVKIALSIDVIVDVGKCHGCWVLCCVWVSVEVGVNSW